MQAGGHRFESVHLHHLNAFRFKYRAPDMNRGFAGPRVRAGGLFDIVKRLCLISVPAPFAAIAAGGDGNVCLCRELCVGLVSTHGDLQSSAEGHLVNALAPRGDEGRSTLR